MRGIDATQSAMFSYISPEQRIPKDHPLRKIRGLCDIALKALSREFDQMYSEIGRPSIAPEKLLRALLLQVLYTIRSERMLMEQLDYNLLFRWFVGLNMDDGVWDAKLCYAGHVLMGNRNGLAVEGKITKATGTAEREAALDMLGDVAGDKRVTVGTDKSV